MKKEISTLGFVLFLLFPFMAFGKDVSVLSPDGKLTTAINITNTISIQIVSDAEKLLTINDIYIHTDKGNVPKAPYKIVSTVKNTVNKVITPVIKEKYATIPERFNEVTVSFGDKSRLQVRVYNNGVAYRLHTALEGELVITSEHAGFAFGTNDKITYQQDANINSYYEAPYVSKEIGELTKEAMGNLPALIEKPSGKCLLILESDVEDYPVMWLKKGDNDLETHFWNYPKTYNVGGGHLDRREVRSTENYMAKTSGTRSYPWRVFGVAEKPTDLMTNQLVYLLAPECKIEDPSWIKPGWVTFDWWAKSEIYGVDFKSGINTETAKYMIDFASDYGLRYFLFDLGWTANENLTQSIEGLSIPEVTAYAITKNIDVMLWVSYDLFDSQMDVACKQFQQWGIKGVKIDYINRSDQEAIRFYRRAAAICAKYKMVVDFHGCSQPDGLRRQYPNVLSRESLIEFEYNGIEFSSRDNPDHHCTLPFIRNVAGPMDYIPATMNNASQHEFRQVPIKPMGQGTRTHSMAMAVIAESPMQMLPDGPSDYYREDECTRFVTQIPLEWDEIMPLEGKVGDYVSLARRRGTTWYVAAITDWTSRKMTLNFDFLPEGQDHQIEIFRDGMNSNIRAIDYKREIRTVKKGDIWELDLASGGGWVARIF